MYGNNPNQSAAMLQMARLWQALRARSGLIFGVMIFGALAAFEMFNYTTTDYALTDLLGDLSFMGLRWSMILAIAFCGMDFAGIARLFTPEKGQGNKTEVWYLLGAWLLAAGMNALLTWWGVSLALLHHPNLGNEILSREALIEVVPVFVAALVVLIRVLIIGTFTMAGDRIFTQPQLEEAARRAPQPVRPIQAAPAPRPAPRYVEPRWEDELDQRPRQPVEPRRMPPPPQPPTPQNRMSHPPMPSSPIRPAPKPAPKPASPRDESELSEIEVNGHNNH